MKKYHLSGFLFIMIAAAYVCINTGCGQIGMPTGGVKDTLAPVLIIANPEQATVNFDNNRINLQFDEYIEIQDIQKQVLISPYQQRNPTIKSNLKSIGIRFRDSLLPNTTYSINFGDAIRDVNEGNIFKNYTYVFSTGPVIDSFTLHGTVELAETGGTDSTLIVMLFRDAVDSSVLKNKPNYIAKVNADGSFNFEYLPAGNFKLFALGDGDGSKTYNAGTEAFAFLDNNKTIQIPDTGTQLKLYAFRTEKEREKIVSKPATKEKKLSYSLNQSGQRQDLLEPLEINFNTALERAALDSILLTDSNYLPILGAVLTIDSTRKILTYRNAWVPGEKYTLLLPKTAVEDSSGNQLTKSDSLHFIAKDESEYGSVVLRFNGLQNDRNPHLLFYQGDQLYISEPIQNNQWSKKLVPPGEYQIRILYDKNENGQWDAGNYETLLQPENVLNIEMKLNVQANWDNEQDISL